MKKVLAGVVLAASVCGILAVQAPAASAETAWYGDRFDEIASNDLAQRAETIYAVHAPALTDSSSRGFYRFYLDKMAERVVNNTARRGEMSCYKVNGWYMAKKADEFRTMRKTSDYAAKAFKAINRSKATKWVNYYATTLNKGVNWAIKTGHKTWARKSISYGIRSNYGMQDCYHQY